MAKNNISHLRASYLTWVVLGFGFLITAAAWNISSNFVRTQAQQRFDNQVNEISSAIMTRMAGYEQVLWGGVGFFGAAGDVNRDKFQIYVSSLNIEKNWPGIQGIGFSIPVSEDEKATHIDQIRAEGFPEYSIKPPGKRDIYSAIIYLEPFDWRNKRAFGYDMWSNDMRRQAMRRARDEGVAATSGIITLVQETESDVQKGFLTYLPLYKRNVPLETVEDRRDAFLGWVYSPFRMGNLMEGILGPRNLDINYEIYDGTQISKDSMLFDSNDIFQDDKRTSADLITHTKEIEIQGRTWTLTFAGEKHALLSDESNEPLFILVAGIVISFLLSYIVWTLGRLQRRAENLARKMTTGFNEANKKLEENVRQLSLSNEELSKFAHVASHDLQEPLRAVASFCNLLKMEYGDKLDATANEYIDFSVDGAKRMKLLVEGLLAYARIGQEATQFDNVDCQVLVEDVLTDLKAAIGDAKAVISFKSLPMVRGDATLLRQLFQNLLQNAIKFKSSDAPEIHINANREGDFWSFSVADNGIGIGDEFADQVFVLYKRLHRSEDYTGSGMGLAICKKIVDRHHGRIWVEKNKKKGSVFCFTLPAK